MVLVGHTSQCDRAGTERRNDWQSTSENVVSDFWYLVQHRTVVGVALAWLAQGARASSVGPCDGCRSSCVLCTGDWLVGPIAMGTPQTRFAFAYARQTRSIRQPQWFKVAVVTSPLHSQPGSECKRLITTVIWNQVLLKRKVTKHA